MAPPTCHQEDDCPPEAIAPSLRPTLALRTVVLAESLSPAGELGGVDECAGQLQGKVMKEGIHVFSIRW